MTPRQALCGQLGLDFHEIMDYRYHAGRTTVPVYAIDEDYFCCTKNDRRPALYLGKVFWNWQVHSRYETFTIWKA